MDLGPLIAGPGQRRDTRQKGNVGEDADAKG